MRRKSHGVVDKASARHVNEQYIPVTPRFMSSNPDSAIDFLELLIQGSFESNFKGNKSSECISHQKRGL